MGKCQMLQPILCSSLTLNPLKYPHRPQRKMISKLFDDFTAFSHGGDLSAVFGAMYA